MITARPRARFPLKIHPAHASYAIVNRAPLSTREGELAMSNDCRQYAARWSILNWLFTILVSFLAFVFIPIEIWTHVSPHGLEGPSAGYVYLLGLCPALLLFALLFAPIGYAIAAGQIRVRRPGFDVIVSISDVKAIRRIHRKDLGFAVRIGLGGYFGTYGSLITTRLGLMAVYATNGKSLVLIERQGGRKLLISPSDPDDFVQRVRDTMPTSMV